MRIASLVTAVLLALLGPLLHFGMLLRFADGLTPFAVGLYLWLCAPYAVAIWLMRPYPAGGKRHAFTLGSPLPGVAYALACLLADACMLYSVFYLSRSSTAAIGLLFIPLWDLLLVGPLAALLASLVVRARQRRRA
ncbi:hypothetical protein [Jeongeupia naejangsanensis]|uniref:DUF4281 domain-containing protein n=1 Tax=Jeongeupia naejangsanensis TaxID=613195 RepID=A0ABS2BMG1_9NEIS|nr:hypothetical protein [Jeongeupia naejangsanensis]MBM3116797.1 hypothetical protein [Jeongeupia naejangsanensis]